MYQTVLVPIATEHKRDTDTALKVARELLGEGGKIIALSVIEPIPAYVDQMIPADIGQGRQEHVAEALDELLEGAEDVQKLILHGPPARTIADFAQGADVDLIVVASHRPEVSDIFLGSTAAWLVRHANCSVHVLR